MTAQGRTSGATHSKAAQEQGRLGDKTTAGTLELVSMVHSTWHVQYKFSAV